MSGAQIRGIRSRLHGLSRTGALAVIAVLLLVIATSIARYYVAAAPSPPILTAVEAKEKDQDLNLYNQITARLARGEAYYPVAADELRRGNYPLKPFVTFRLPTLAALTAALGPAGTMLLLYALIAATLAAWWRKLEGAFDDPSRRISGVLLVGAGLSVALSGQYAPMHELWSGILLALAMALYHQDRWWPAFLATALALGLRELALPFVLLMGAFALFRRRWAEFGAWSALVLFFAVFLALHMREVADVVRASDPASPGWARLGGWTAFLRTMDLTGAFRAFPHWVGVIATLLALFGWLSWKSPTGLFASLFFCGYAVIFMVLGRPDNFYWGLMVTPAFMLGLAFLPRAFGDLRIALKRTRTGLAP